MSKPEMTATRCVFTQDADPCQDEIGEQQIVVEHENSTGNPDGVYYVMSTDRWAFNSVADAVDMLRRAGVAETCTLDGDPDYRPEGRRIFEEAI